MLLYNVAVDRDVADSPAGSGSHHPASCSTLRLPVGAGIIVAIVLACSLTTGWQMLPGLRTMRAHHAAANSTQPAQSPDMNRAPAHHAPRAVCGPNSKKNSKGGCDCTTGYVVSDIWFDYKGTCIGCAVGYGVSYADEMLCQPCSAFMGTVGGTCTCPPGQEYHTKTSKCGEGRCQMQCCLVSKASRTLPCLFALRYSPHRPYPVATYLPQPKPGPHPPSCSLPGWEQRHKLRQMRRRIRALLGLPKQSGLPDVCCWQRRRAWWCVS